MNRGHQLTLVAFGFATVSAIIHFLLGFGGVYNAIFYQGEALLPVLSILTAVTIFALAIVHREELAPNPTVYAVGAAVLAVPIIAYADVHAFNVAESTLGLEMGGLGGEVAAEGEHTHTHADGSTHNHDTGRQAPHTILLDHLRSDLAALVSKVSETVAAISFAALYALER